MVIVHLKQELRNKLKEKAEQTKLHFTTLANFLSPLLARKEFNSNRKVAVEYFGTEEGHCTPQSHSYCAGNSVRLAKQVRDSVRCCALVNLKLQQSPEHLRRLALLDFKEIWQTIL